MTDDGQEKWQPELLWRSMLELVFPRRCPYCGEVIGRRQQCPACAPKREQWKLQPHRLDPAAHYFGEMSGAAAVYRYQGMVRQAVLRLKYAGCQWYGNELGNTMAAELFGCTFHRKYGIIVPERVLWGRTGYDVIVPVPATGRARGYNVPLLLARPIAQCLGLPLQARALVRTRTSRHQAGLSLSERLANAAGAFRAADRCDVEGRRVLLVDDVITTGATAAACTHALLAAGAESVFAVSLASAQRETDSVDF